MTDLTDWLMPDKADAARLVHKISNIASACLPAALRFLVEIKRAAFAVWSSASYQSSVRQT